MSHVPVKFTTRTNQLGYLYGMQVDGTQRTGIAKLVVASLLVVPRWFRCVDFVTPLCTGKRRPVPRCSVPEAAVRAIRLSPAVLA